MDRNKLNKRILFIGVPDMGYVGLDTLLYAGANIVGVMGPLKTHNTYFSFKNFVKARGLNFIEYDSLDDTNLINEIKELNIDLGIVCSFNNKIPKNFIDAIKDGIVNVHPSLLPQYRGGNPYSWVIINNEKETGVTLHFMSEKFDEGDIIYQEKCPIIPTETMGTIFEKTNQLACKLLLKTIFEYERQGNLPRKTQPQGDFIKANNLKNNELFINYNKSALEIERFVRALNPYISALTIFRNQIVKVHKVSICDCKIPENTVNGEIIDINNNKIYIKTNIGAICLDVIQSGGLFIGDTKNFIDIIKPKIGEIFKNG